MPVVELHPVVTDRMRGYNYTTYFRHIDIDSSKHHVREPNATDHWTERSQSPLFVVEQEPRKRFAQFCLS